MTSKLEHRVTKLEADKPDIGWNPLFAWPDPGETREEAHARVQAEHPGEHVMYMDEFAACFLMPRETDE